VSAALPSCTTALDSGRLAQQGNGSQVIDYSIPSSPRGNAVRSVAFGRVLRNDVIHWGKATVGHVVYIDYLAYVDAEETALVRG
jgi:hypothetical protein